MWLNVFSWIEMSTVQLIHTTIPSVLISDRVNQFELQTSASQLLNLLQTLKLHSLTLFQNLVELTACDITSNPLRFYVSYFLLSIQYNARLCVSVQTDALLPVVSVTSLFNSANWF
jgi:NADH dehydrogenase (ubiquinone) Fe-S protein 3